MCPNEASHEGDSGLNRSTRDYDDRLVRFNIGLEAVSDLIDDLTQALERR